MKISFEIVKIYETLCILRVVFFFFLNKIDFLKRNLLYREVPKSDRITLLVENVCASLNKKSRVTIRQIHKRIEDKYLIAIIWWGNDNSFDIRKKNKIIIEKKKE